MREVIELRTNAREMLVDITAEVGAVVRRSGIQDGLINVDAQGATTAVMIQENGTTVCERMWSIYCAN